MREVTQGSELCAGWAVADVREAREKVDLNS